jgi:hypothetical protein
MHMTRSALTIACLLVGLASTIHAQTDTVGQSADSVDALVVDHDFTGGFEFVRVFLQAGQVYRAELSSTDVGLEIRTPGRATQLPRSYTYLPSDTPSGSSIIEIYPEVETEYEIRPTGIANSRLGTRLRLYRDVSSSRRRQYVRHNPGWEVGVEVASGWHSAYPQSQTALPVGAADPQAGTDVDFCFSARTPPGKQGFGWCVFGLGYQTQHAAPSILWIFTEPRVRILGHSQAHQSNWELGALLRFGVGMISASSHSPTVLGPGVYVARHIRGSSRGGGLTLQAAYTRAFHQGFGRRGLGPVLVADDIVPKSHQLSFGIGWYK